MQYTHLGRTGLKVSRLCLGTMNFGAHTSEADSHAIMDQALALDVQFFDTADVYGWTPGEGVTEQIVGRWIAQGGGRREQIVLATKVYNDMSKEGQPDPNLARGLSARKIIACCEGSLRRLQTDCIDLYQMHHIDRECPFDEIWEAMETLVRQGKVIYVGSSNFAGWDIAHACGEAARRHFQGLVCEQSIYHLDNRMVELEVLPSCRHFGLGFIPWSPLGGGMLGGVLNKPKDGRRGAEGMADRIEAKRAQLEPYEKLCADLGEAPANVALAWLLSNPVVTAPIIGPRTAAQLKDAQRAVEIELSTETLAKLDEIWPGPGGEAPKAYAW
ncbi:MAG: aldo/keto reductase [Planctomycetaceae bacterium]|nr:aldo/keto reductase [Planctomycetaceae bacterium]